MSFWGELKRRNVFRVAVAYAVIAWLLIQVADTLLPVFGAPDWILPVTVLLLAMGFVIAVFLSWVYELTPEGLVRTEDVPLAESVTGATGKKLNVAIILLLVLALGFVAVDQYVLEERADDAVADAAVAEAEGATPVADRASNRLPNSVAVLPFENLSPDPDDAYFADGLHEEVLNQLVKLSNLSVISRTTMMQYAGMDRALPEIADELNVETVMEGSVRYAGQRIRVTVQLIDPETDLHLISETYDADLSNLDEVFDIQSDIAMRVANALQAEFSPTEQARIERMPTDSPEAWSEFLAAVAFNARFTPDDFLRAFARIDRALALDPDFALAWAMKARAYANAIPYFPGNASEYAAIADEAIGRALETGVDIPEVHAQAAMVATVSGDWREVETQVNRAAELGMGQDELSDFALVRIAVGRFDGLPDVVPRFREYDPLNPAASFWIIAMMDALGDTEAALAEYERGKGIFDENWVGHSNAFAVLLGAGEHERARALAESVLSSPVVSAVLDDFDSPADALATLQRLYDGDAYTDLGSRQWIAILAAYFGDHELALRAMRDSLNQFAVSAYLWRPVFAATRRHPDFQAFARDFGFVDYWQEYGWPDSCEPVNGQQFVCR